MRLTADRTGDTLVIRALAERLDAAVVLIFKERMRELVAEPAGRVVLDLGQVRFLDSSGLGALVFVMKHLAPERRFALVGLTPPVERVLRLTRMDTVFNILPAADGAPDGG